MKLYTKSELREKLKKGFSLDQLLDFKMGQECLIFKAEDFCLGDKVIYIPDVDLNEIDIYDIAADDEEIEEYLSYCYTGDDFLEICENNLKYAERAFWFCDWQNPSTAHEDLCIGDVFENGGYCMGCAYFDTCGDYERMNPCNERKLV